MSAPTSLQRHLGLFQATALNVTWIVGAGVFATIPLMLLDLPGPYAILGWVIAALLMFCDGLIWSELGAAMPGSGGSYLYLLESYGRNKWGRLMAFLFIWQILISGPLEAGSGLIAMAGFSTGVNKDFADFNKTHSFSQKIIPAFNIEATFDPARLLVFLIGCFVLYLLHRRIEGLGKLTVTLWVGVLGVIAWILIDGAVHFDPAVAFAWNDKSGQPAEFSWSGLGATMRLAMYSYLGYYGICYLGDEVRNPGRTIPWSILLSSVLVATLFIGLHLAMLGVVSWTEIPRTLEEANDYSLPAAFMRKLHGEGIAVVLVSLCLMWSCMGSVFAGILSYSRIPFGAARYGHFFKVFGQIHPTLAIPHVSLWLVGGLTLFWSFFGLGVVIDALMTTRIIEQFITQTIGVMILRRIDPERPRPFRIWLYPVPCFLALVGWLFMYVTAQKLYITLGLAGLALGVVAFLAWANHARTWPFASEQG